MQRCVLHSYLLYTPTQPHWTESTYSEYLLRVPTPSTYSEYLLRVPTCSHFILIQNEINYIRLCLTEPR